MVMVSPGSTIASRVAAAWLGTFAAIEQAQTAPSMTVTVTLASDFPSGFATASAR